MSRKSMITVGVVALVVLALGAGLLLMPRKTTPTASTSAGSTSGSSTASSGASAAATGTSSYQGSTVGSGTVASGGADGVGTNPNLPKLKPFPGMPEPTIPAETLTSPAAPGKMLAPLTAAPEPTISGFPVGAVPDGSQYAIVMRPYGVGPSTLLGSRIAIRVDSAKSIGKAPAFSDISRANLLVVVDTTNGGAVAKGGTYTATLTLRSDGTKVLPILSKAKAAN